MPGHPRPRHNDRNRRGRRDSWLQGQGKISDPGKQDRDTVYGGPGNDTIDVREGNKGLVNRDFVDCGRGRDTVFFDEGSDTVVRCEKKNPN